MTREQALNRYTEIFDELFKLDQKRSQLAHERDDCRKLILATEYAPQRVKRETNNRAIRGATTLRVLQTMRDYNQPATCNELQELLPEMSVNAVRMVLDKQTKRGIVQRDDSGVSLRFSLAVHKQPDEQAMISFANKVLAQS